MGVAIIHFDITTLKIVKSHVSTFTGSKLYAMQSWNEQTQSARYARINAHKENLLRLFQVNNPVQIVAEDGFFNQRRPNAFAVLMEVQIAIRQAVYEYSHWRELFLIDPPTVKKAVGVAGNADKFKVKDGVCALSDLKYEGLVPLIDLDEHSIDALAVAYAKLKSIT